MELKRTVFFLLTAIPTSHASRWIHVWREELWTASWTISMSHKWKFKALCMQYAHEISDLMLYRLEECSSPRILTQNFGIWYTLFKAVEFLSAVCRTHEQANWARQESKSAGRAVQDLMPSLKAKIAWSMVSMVKPFKNTSISAEMAVRLDWLSKMYLLTSRILSPLSFMNRS